MSLLRIVKQAVRSTPAHGLGYGILRRLDAAEQPELRAAAAQNPPALLVNYLGRFSSAGGHFTPVQQGTVFADAFAVSLDGAVPLTHPLELNAFLDGDRLALGWTWAARLLQEKDVAAVSAAMENIASELAENARTKPALAAATLVPADVPGTGLDAAALARIEAAHGPALAVLPLGPLQLGLLFHDQLGARGGNYSSVTVLELGGAVSGERLRAALELMLDAHPQLGASFNPGAGPAPVQVIPHPAFRAPVDFAEILIADHGDPAAATASRFTARPMRSRRPSAGSWRWSARKRRAPLTLSAGRCWPQGWCGGPTGRRGCCSAPTTCWWTAGPLH